MAGAPKPGDQPALIQSPGSRGRIRRLLMLAAMLLPVVCFGTGEPDLEVPVVAKAVSIKVDRVAAGRSGNWAEIGVEVQVSTAGKGALTVTPHAPAGITIKPASRVIEVEGSGPVNASFRVRSQGGNWRQAGEVSISAELVVNGQNWQDSVAVVWPASLDSDLLFHVPSGWFVALIAALLAIIWYRYRFLATGTGRSRLPDAHLLFDVLALLAIEAFIIAQLNSGFLLTSTTTTGGDTASHFYALEYLKQVLLPAGLVSGWTPGNYAGFPILQFYFPLNFLFMVFMSGLVSLQVAFKLGSLAGILLLPVAAFSFLRLVRVPFPGPGIGAALTLPLLFNSSHSMWGGNILSSLAGEFSYSLSMALSLLLLGSIYRGLRENNGVVRNALLVFLVGFSHGYTLLFAEAMSTYLLIGTRGFIRRGFYLGRVYALAFCLLAFWIVPLLVFTRYTTSYDLVWTIHSWREIFPPLLVPSLVIGAVGTLGLLVAGTGKYRAAGREFLPVVGYLWFGLAMAVVFFVAAPKIGVVDIRYVPYGHLLGSLLAAVALGWLGWSLRRWKVDWVLLPVIVTATMFWVAASPGPVASWAKWNYEGFEAKATWPVLTRHWTAISTIRAWCSNTRSCTMPLVPAGPSSRCRCLPVVLRWRGCICKPRSARLLCSISSRRCRRRIPAHFRNILTAVWTLTEPGRIWKCSTRGTSSFAAMPPSRPFAQPQTTGCVRRSEITSCGS